MAWLSCRWNFADANAGNDSSGGRDHVRPIPREPPPGGIFVVSIIDRPAVIKSAISARTQTGRTCHRQRVDARDHVIGSIIIKSGAVLPLSDLFVNFSAQALMTRDQMLRQNELSQLGREDEKL